MHGDRASDNLAAKRTNASTAFNGSGTRFQPASPSICGGAAYPIAGVLAGFIFTLVQTMTPLRAEPIAADRYVLTYNPQRQGECRTTIGAHERRAWLDYCASHRAGFAFVWRRQANAQLVADKRWAAHDSVCHMPLAAARPRAEAMRIPIVAFRELNPAHFTDLCYRFHEANLSQDGCNVNTYFMGSGSTGKARLENELAQGLLPLTHNATGEWPLPAKEDSHG